MIARDRSTLYDLFCTHYRSADTIWKDTAWFPRKCLSNSKLRKMRVMIAHRSEELEWSVPLVSNFKTDCGDQREIAVRSYRASVKRDVNRYVITINCNRSIVTAATAWRLNNFSIYHQCFQVARIMSHRDILFDDKFRKLSRSFRDITRRTYSATILLFYLNTSLDPLAHVIIDLSTRFAELSRRLSAAIGN